MRTLRTTEGLKVSIDRPNDDNRTTYSTATFGWPF